MYIVYGLLMRCINVFLLAVVGQYDTHWEHLTARESLSYAAQLCCVEDPTHQVQIILTKLGLTTAADIRCNRLSGGQRRRLSLAFALLKNPYVIFLDEVTSGLDSAASYTIVEEIRQLSVTENLVVVCTIHQPSTRVFHLFGQVMLLSQGRQAYLGPVNDMVPYLSSTGYPLPPETNPAEFALDLLNADFSGGQHIAHLLEHWAKSKGHKKDISEQEEKDVHQGASNYMVKGAAADWGDASLRTTTMTGQNSFFKELSIILHRHFIMTLRDPVLYLGRCIFFLLSNMVFAAVFWNVRDYTQDQAINLIWVHIFFSAVPANSKLTLCGFISFRGAERTI